MQAKLCAFPTTVSCSAVYENSYVPSSSASYTNKQL